MWNPFQAVGFLATKATVGGMKAAGSGTAAAAHALKEGTTLGVKAAGYGPTGFIKGAWSALSPFEKNIVKFGAPAAAVTVAGGIALSSHLSKTREASKLELEAAADLNNQQTIAGVPIVTDGPMLTRLNASRGIGGKTAGFAQPAPSGAESAEVLGAIR